MKRRGLLVGGGASLAWPTIARAQGKTYRVGLVASDTTVPGGVDAFRDELKKRGYVEGKDLTLDVRWPVVSLAQEPDLVPAMVRSGPDVIATWSTLASVAAQSATRAAQTPTSIIPVVMMGVGDPLGAGLVASLTQPGGNVTGVSDQDGVVAVKAAEVFREAVPGLRRLGVLYNAANSGANTQISALQMAAQQLGLETWVSEASSPNDYQTAFARFSSSAALGIPAINGAFFIPDTSTSQFRQMIADWGLANRMPTMFQRRENVDAGGLISYGSDLVQQFRQGAVYVDKILKGAKPATLPVAQPEKYVLVINRKTAQAIGVNVPSALLSRANAVVD
jgi:putative tryptophan/tyrosine transport system substrate-binding protein